MGDRPLSDEAGEKSREFVRDVRPVEFCGDIDAGQDLSGAAVVGDFLVLGGDEGHKVQILVRDAAASAWRPQRRVSLAQEDQEADIEAIDYGQGHLYVIGSHSFRRRRMKPELSVRKNRERLLEVQHEPARNRLYRLAFDGQTGKVGRAERIDLSKRLRKDPLLGLFYGLPSKENGIDIEGLAYRDEQLYLGFRGPVLRDNYVPVMVLEFDRPKHYELRFVRLDGQGIRDMVALRDGFLILAGPVNDAPGPFCLWWWDGGDQVPGSDHDVRAAVPLGAVTTSGGAKAEGLALLAEHDDGADVMVVYDTDTAGQAVSMRVDLSRLAP